LKFLFPVFKAAPFGFTIQTPIKEKCMNLFVGNLAWTTTQADLEAAFGAYGEVTSAKIMTDRETGKSRGFAFVEMPNDAEARKAVDELNGKDLKGRAINVNEARPREERPRSGGGGFGGGDRGERGPRRW
jgi:RNA recognition motif-containing protein